MLENHLITNSHEIINKFDKHIDKSIINHQIFAFRSANR